MTDHDLQLLALGTSLGIYLMLAVQIIGGIIDDRRDRRVVRDALKRSAGDLYLSSFRRYQLRERSRA